jgi:hypothetical protein
MAISSFFMAWFYLGMVSLLLLPFRSDWFKIQIDLKKLFFSSVLHFVVTSIMCYLFIPFILIDSIINIYKNIS